MAIERDRRGAVICGAYGMDNAGDDAVLASIVSSLRRIDEAIPVTVLARREKQTARRFGVEAVHPLRLFRWLAAMRRAALFISGGGSLIQDVTSRRSLLYYLAAIRLAKACGCAVMLYGCGIGPLKRRGARRMAARVLNGCADVITLRDAESEKLLADMGVAKPRVLLAADPAAAREFPRGERERRFGVALRPWPSFWPHVPEIAEAVRYVYETYRLEPVFLCLAPGDRAAAESVGAALPDIPYTVTSDARRAARMSLVLSMRLHGLVFALGGGAPAAGLSYDPKVEAFCREAGFPCLDIGEADREALCRMIDEAAHLDAESLSAAAAELRLRERVNAGAAAELLSGREAGA